MEEFAPSGTSPILNGREIHPEKLSPLQIGL